MIEAREDSTSEWHAIQRELAAFVPDDTYRHWLEPLRAVAKRGPTLYLSAHPRVVRWVRRRYLDLIRRAAERAGIELQEIELLTDREAAEAMAPPHEAASVVTLNPGYTFERFVIGPGNQIAHAGALAVAEAPGEAYNPLFLHGPPGLGKTHLLGAIANYLHRNSPQLAVHYTTAESFTNEFVSCLHSSGIDAFKERYRRSDVLLIDDVQFLQGKAHTADEFFHTFNALYEGGAQLVLTADRVPAELVGLVDRLRDRFEWGLTVPVEPPDLATRLVFLGNLAKEQPEALPPEALRALAAKSAANLRVLKGALTRVVAHSSLGANPITTESIDTALPGDSIAQAATCVEVGEIQRAVAERLGISTDALLSPTRTASVASARQLAMHLTRELTDLSLPEIAAAFNRRDHTTVLHAIRKIERRALEDGALARTIEELSGDLRIDRDRTD